MNIRLTLTAFATGAALLLTQPALAGGPVLVEDDFVAEARPSSEGRWVLPVIVGLVVICAIACGGDDEPAPIKPGPVCNGEGC